MTTVVAVKRPSSGLRISELARAVGVAPDTLRYYERVGLLPPPSRTSSGYRTYGVAAIDRMRFIQGAQRLGLTLRDVRDLLAVRDTGTCPCEPAEQLLRRRLDELERELTRLTTLRADILRMAEQLPSAQCPPPTPGTWCPPQIADPLARPETPDLGTRPEIPDPATEGR
jgi:DNA-binding transcriptional MerR regulator